MTTAPRPIQWDIYEEHLDEATFLEALKALLDADAEKIEKDRESAAVHERAILFRPKSRVSIDGLAPPSRASRRRRSRAGR